MKRVQLLLLALLFAATLCVPGEARPGGEETEEPEEEEEESGTEVSCSAFAALKIRVSRGRCKGKAGASCASISSSQSVIKEASNVWWSDGEQCEKAKIEEAALAIAYACASVYVESIAQVSCSGKGFACGWSIAEGSSMALAFARAIAQAAVDAGGADASAFCVADVEAVSGAIARAAASAESKACVKDQGSEEDFQSAFVEQVAEALAEAFVTATAATCSEEGTAAASTLCTGEAGSTATETTTAEATEKATVEAESEQLDACHNAGECCDPSYGGRICNCAGDGCEYGPWLKASSAKGARLRSWRMRNRKVCFCYPKAT